MQFSMKGHISKGLDIFFEPKELLWKGWFVYLSSMWNVAGV